MVNAINCLFPSRNDARYKEHLRTHTTHKCETCGEVIQGTIKPKACWVIRWLTLQFLYLLPGLRTYQKHVKRVHLNIIKDPVQCSHCPKQCASNHKLKLHILTAHTADADKPFQCGWCDKGFCKRERRDQHVNSVHTRSTKYTCR